MLISGIYEITFVGTAWFYYGRSNNFERRKAEHLNALRKRTHENIKLQRIFDKYGEEAFMLTPIVFEESENLEQIEQKFLDSGLLNPYCMNISLSSGTPDNRGRKLSEEHKEKLRIAKLGKAPWNKGVPCSEETKLKVSQGLLARNSQLSEEERKAMGAHNLGRKHTEETKAKIKATKQRKKEQQETKE